jgi:hypothetical protein
MTQACCPSCRLRFTRAAAAYLLQCPECGAPPEVLSAEHVVGFRLDDSSHELPAALAAALAIPPPGEPSP